MSRDSSISLRFLVGGGEGEVLPLSEDVEGGERGRGEGDSSLCDGGGTGKEEEGEAPPLGAEEEVSQNRCFLDQDPIGVG